jgi:DNA-binding transcriptional MocR family regulator
MAIHFQNGFELTGTVKLKPSVWRQLGLKRHTVYRAVDELEAAGLITAIRKKGCSATITLCQPTRV